MNTEIARMGGQQRTDEYDVDLEEGTAPSEKPAEPASQAMVELIIPQGVEYMMDFMRSPGGLCIKIPVGEVRR
ncbi:MAG: hypothetical protein JNL82_35915 [Myxococcales bacterium]|jgi:hypothetical protein|nr:hypothetical protein [Myxococcales bacterium]